MKAPATTHDYDDLLASDPTRYSHTAPPAKNGLLHLALGFPLIIALAVLVNSCAAPARLPMGPVVHHTNHDVRTKLAEPQPSRIR